MYKKRYCIICGKEISRGSLCEEHYNISIQKNRKKKKPKIKICSVCGRIFYKGKWMEKFRYDVSKFVIEKTICPKCSIIINPKINFVIQLRGDKSKFEHVINIVEKYSVIKNIEYLKEGININSYASFKNIQKIYRIFKKLGYNLLITRKHISRDKITSKNIYRVYMRVRL